MPRFALLFGTSVTEMLTFAHPALLIGAAAAGLPWLIHMILRPRPQRVRFPAVALLRPVLVAGRRASKLRNLWLLLIRMGVILFIAALLAGPSCRSSDAINSPSGPAAHVIVFDDSLSMTYRQDERTLAQIAADQLGRLLGEPRSFKAGSQWGIVFAADDATPDSLTPDISDIVRSFSTHVAAPHARSLAAALRRAAAMLRDVHTGGTPMPHTGGTPMSQRRKRLHIFTDLAAHAWRDAPSGLFADMPGIQVSVNAATRAERPNIAIRKVGGTERVHSARSPIVLNASVSAYAAPARCRIVVRQSDSVIARSGILPITADASREYALTLPALPAGPHGFTLMLDPDDRLSFDRTRYATVQTGAAPTVLMLVADLSDADTDLTALIVRNLIAPPTLDPARQAVDFRIVTPLTLADQLHRKPALIVIPGDLELTADHARALRSAVQRGAQLLLLPAARETRPMSEELWGLFSIGPLHSRGTDVTTITWERASPFYDADEGLAEFTRCAVRRRLVLDSPPAEAVVHGRYADAAPALLSVTLGDGALWLLTTSPDPQWSDLGTRAAGMMTFLYRLIDRAAGPPNLVADFVAGERSRRSFAGLPSNGPVRVSRLTDSAAASVWLRLKQGVPDRDWPTDAPGLFGIRGSGQTAPAVVYSVNWPIAESDTTPITNERIASILGTDDVVQRLDSNQDRRESRSALARLARLVPPEPAAAVLIVLLLVSESLLGNRRRPSSASAVAS